jgi:hypothetical protein
MSALLVLFKAVVKYSSLALSVLDTNKPPPLSERTRFTFACVLLKTVVELQMLTGYFGNEACIDSMPANRS